MVTRLTPLLRLATFCIAALMPTLVVAACDSSKFNEQLRERLFDKESAPRDDLRRQAIACELQNPYPVYWWVADWYEEMGDDAANRGDPAQAEKHYALAFQYWEKQADGFPERLQTAAGRIQRKHALLIRNRGDTSAALHMLRSAEKIINEDISPSPWEALEVASEIANMLVSKGDVGQASQVMGKALELAEQSRDGMAKGEHTGIVYRSFLQHAELLHRLNDEAAQSRFEKAVRAAQGTDTFVSGMFDAYRALHGRQTADPKGSQEALARIEKMESQGLQRREAEARIAFARYLLAKRRPVEAEAQLLFAATRREAVGAQTFIEATEALSELYFEQGRYSEAITWMNAILTVVRRFAPGSCPGACTFAMNLAMLLAVKGDYAGALQLLEPLQVSGEPLPDRFLVNLRLQLAHIYAKLIKFPDALKTLDEIESAVSLIEPDDQVASLELRTECLAALGRAAEAKEMLEARIESSQNAGAPILEVRIRAALADLLVTERDIAGAERHFRTALTILQSINKTPTTFMAILERSLAASIIAQAPNEAGLREARGLLSNAKEKLVGSLDPLHPTIAEIDGFLAFSYAGLRDYESALASAREQSGIFRRRGWSLTGLSSPVGAEEAAQARRAYEQNLQLLALLNELGALNPTGAQEAFELSQLAAPSRTSEALLQMNVILGEKDGPRQQLRHDLQRAEASLRARERDLIELIKRNEENRDRRLEALVRRDIEALRDRKGSLYDRLMKPVSENAPSVSETSLGMAEAQALLRADEAILVYFISEGRTISWLVRPGDAPKMKTLPLRQVEAAIIAVELRRTLDGRPGVPTGAIPFNTEMAAAAHEALVAPFGDDLTGVNHLFVVTNGPLQSVPFGIFLRSRTGLVPNTPPDYTLLDWLARRFAISVLPSISSLRVVRNHPPSQAKMLFAAIGNPKLEASGVKPRTSDRPVLLAKIGDVANRIVLSTAAPQLELTGTINNMISALGLKRDWPAIYERENATEANVRQLLLNDYGVIAFVTHGLTTTSARSEEPVLAEPALVLTPPSTQGIDPAADGLLTASEIAGLQMFNANLVLLVACNSAAAEEAVTLEAFSGLPRAFFLAGARSVIASHWFANQQAADRLFFIMLRQLHLKPRSTIAEAQKAAINWMLSRKGVWSHPHFWAPFVIIGDGGNRLHDESAK